jgi:hypothetical protein
VKIYSARQSVLDKLLKFEGKDMWVRFDMCRVSFELGWYIKIVAITYGNVNYMIAMDTETFAALDSGVDPSTYKIIQDLSSRTIQTLPVEKFKRTYKLHTPIEAFTTEELQEMIDTAEVYLE